MDRITLISKDEVIPGVAAYRDGLQQIVDNVTARMKDHGLPGDRKFRVLSDAFAAINKAYEKLSLGAVSDVDKETATRLQMKALEIIANAVADAVPRQH